MTQTRMSVSIGGLRMGVAGRKESLAALDSPRYRDFHAPDSDLDLQLTVRDEPVRFSDVALPPETMLFDSGTVWSLYGTADSLRIILRSPAHGGAPYRMAAFDRDLTRGEIVTFTGPGTDLPPKEHDPLEFPLSEILMVCLLSMGRGLMVHACGLEHEGRGMLFPGNSTDGKSTMAGLWKGSARILNDDRIILRHSGGAIRMYGTPWHGDMSDVSAEGVGLSSVNFLFHGDGNSLRPVCGAKAVSMLLKRSFLPLWSRSGMEFSLNFCESIEKQVPFRELHFLPDAGAVEFLQCRG